MRKGACVRDAFEKSVLLALTVMMSALDEPVIRRVFGFDRTMRNVQWLLGRLGGAGTDFRA